MELGGTFLESEVFMKKIVFLNCQKGGIYKYEEKTFKI